MQTSSKPEMIHSSGLTICRHVIALRLKQSRALSSSLESYLRLSNVRRKRWRAIIVVKQHSDCASFSKSSTASAFQRVSSITTASAEPIREWTLMSWQPHLMPRQTSCVFLKLFMPQAALPFILRFNRSAMRNAAPSRTALTLVNIQMPTKWSGLRLKSNPSLKSDAASRKCGTTV